MTHTNTPNYKFKLIDFDVTTWHDDEYDNWRSVDALLGTFFASPGYTGVWANSTAYTIGQRAADTVDGKVYEVLVDHTSAASPIPFATNRGTNPTFWQEWLATHAADKNNPHSVPNTNVIINGSFDIWQRGVQFIGPTSGDYTADRWQVGMTGTGSIDVLQFIGVPDTGSDFSVQLNVQTADGAIAASDLYNFSYKVEGFDALRFRLGEADAQEITLSFQVRGSKTGIHCVAFLNSANNRNYIVEYTINVADTWEKKTITLTGDVTGTWLTDNGTGLIMTWVLAAGTNFHGAAGVWQAGNLRATVNQVNVMDDNLNELNISQVKLELGSVATRYERRLYEEELALCQRYFQKTFLQGVTPAQNAGQLGALFYRASLATAVSFAAYYKYAVVMRASPAVTFYSTSEASALWWNSSRVSASGAANALVVGDASLGVGNAQHASDSTSESILIHFSLDAEL